jgi:hypothetical protein
MYLNKEIFRFNCQNLRATDRSAFAYSKKWWIDWRKRADDEKIKEDINNREGEI